MGLAHWLMIAGALLVLVGFIGAVLQRNARVAADPVPMQKPASEQSRYPILFLPKCPDRSAILPCQHKARRIFACLQCYKRTEKRFCCP